MVALTYNVLPPIVDVWFQVLFHSPPGVLFTFPSRYYFTIGHLVIFSLTRWSSQIHKEFPVLHATRDRILTNIVLNYKTFTFYGVLFQILHITKIV